MYNTRPKPEDSWFESAETLKALPKYYDIDLDGSKERKRNIKQNQFSEENMSGVCFAKFASMML